MMLYCERKSMAYFYYITVICSLLKIGHGFSSGNCDLKISFDSDVNIDSNSTLDVPTMLRSYHVPSPMACISDCCDDESCTNVAYDLSGSRNPEELNCFLYQCDNHECPTKTSMGRYVYKVKLKDQGIESTSTTSTISTSTSSTTKTTTIISANFRTSTTQTTTTTASSTAPSTSSPTTTKAPTTAFMVPVTTSTEISSTTTSTTPTPTAAAPSSSPTTSSATATSTSTVPPSTTSPPIQYTTSELASVVVNITSIFANTLSTSEKGENIIPDTDSEKIFTSSPTTTSTLASASPTLTLSTTLPNTFSTDSIPERKQTKIATSPVDSDKTGSYPNGPTESGLATERQTNKNNTEISITPFRHSYGILITFVVFGLMIVLTTIYVISSRLSESLRNYRYRHYRKVEYLINDRRWHA